MTMGGMVDLGTLGGSSSEALVELMHGVAGSLRFAGARLERFDFQEAGGCAVDEHSDRLERV
jgi:hypothetical protein